MASRNKNFYVVWIGTSPGVYTTWAECDDAIRGYSNPKYKSFPTLESAEKAFLEGPNDYWGTNKFVSSISEDQLALIGRPVSNSVCVDTAWFAESEIMEYRGVWHHDKSVAFEAGPFENATKNIGKFLAIVHAIALMKKQSIDWPVYSDSKTAIRWVRRKHVKAKSMRMGETSEKINDLIARALRWLEVNDFKNDILIWNTKAWGENPAAYSRK